MKQPLANNIMLVTLFVFENCVLTEFSELAAIFKGYEIISPGV